MAEPEQAKDAKDKDAEGKPTDDILHVPAPEQYGMLDMLKPGDTVAAHIDWERRHKLMRFHTATHLLCHLVPQPVNGCSITPDYARLDFHMTEPLDKAALLRILVEPKNALVRQFQRLLGLDNVELTFTDEALSTAAPRIWRVSFLWKTPRAHTVTRSFSSQVLSSAFRDSSD